MFPDRLHFRGRVWCLWRLWLLQPRRHAPCHWPLRRCLPEGHCLHPRDIDYEVSGSGTLQGQSSRGRRGNWNVVRCLQEEGVLTCSLSKVTPSRLEYTVSEERCLFHSLLSPHHTDECWQHSRYLINIYGINIHGSKSREMWKCSCLSGKELAMMSGSGPY